jgi:hypothetical protein
VTRGTAAPTALLAALLALAPPALAQPGPDKAPAQPRLPQVLSPLDPARQGRGLPRVISPGDPPAEGGAAMPAAPLQPPAARPAVPDSRAAACTPQQVAAITAALAQARSRIAAGIRMLAEEPDHPHVRLWFGTAPRSLVMTVLSRTATRLSSTAGVELHCNDTSRCVGAVTAYAQYLTRTLVDAQGRPAASYRLDEGQILGVCPAFFRAGMEGTGTRWGILVHEATHFAAATRDHVYGRAAALALARTDPARALENADTYMLFIETLPRR